MKSNFENIIVIRDLNIDVSDPDKNRNNYLSNFVDTFSISNLINKKTCRRSICTTLDIMLTSRPKCFQKTSTVVTGLSHFHKIIISCLKTTFEKAIVNKHASLKEKIVRENNAPFMMKELKKAIMNRSSPAASYGQR